MAEENQLGDVRQNPGRGGKPRINVPPPPTKLDISGNLEVAWCKFKRSWTNYEVATGLVDETSEYRTAVLLTTIGDDAADIFDGFVFENGHEKNIDSVLKKFEDFCVDETNEVYESYKFHNRNQQPGETIDAYVAVLRRLAKGCNSGPLEERMVRDRVVAGIASDVVRKKLLQEDSCSGDTWLWRPTTSHYFPHTRKASSVRPRGCKECFCERKDTTTQSCTRRVQKCI